MVVVLNGFGLAPAGAGAGAGAEAAVLPSFGGNLKPPTTGAAPGPADLLGNETPLDAGLSPGLAVAGTGLSLKPPVVGDVLPLVPKANLGLASLPGLSSVSAAAGGPNLVAADAVEAAPAAFEANLALACAS